MRRLASGNRFPAVRLPRSARARSRIGRRAAVLFMLLTLAWLIAGCRPAPDKHTALSTQVRQELARVQTVQGRLNISQGGVALKQEFWQELPLFLRTETDSGPGAFQGTIIVLNDHDGWVYSPALNMVTLVDRTAYTPEVAGEVGAGSALERLPADVLRIIDLSYPLHKVGNETVAGRNAEHWEFAVPAGDATFPRGPLHVWLDSKTSYPLALRDAAGREIRFDSVAFNAAIDPRVFDFVPPPGALVQRVEPGR